MPLGFAYQTTNKGENMAVKITDICIAFGSFIDE